MPGDAWVLSGRHAACTVPSRLSFARPMLSPGIPARHINCTLLGLSVWEAVLKEAPLAPKQGGQGQRISVGVLRLAFPTQHQGT